jgi:hypothetical protein
MYVSLSKTESICFRLPRVGYGITRHCERHRVVLIDFRVALLWVAEVLNNGTNLHHFLASFTGSHVFCFSGCGVVFVGGSCACACVNTYEHVRASKSNEDVGIL